MNNEPLEFQLDCVEDEIIRLDWKRSQLIKDLTDTELLIHSLKRRKEYILFEMGQ